MPQYLINEFLIPLTFLEEIYYMLNVQTISKYFQNNNNHYNYYLEIISL